jgi:alkylation response protein AidB-like acyl-CoA dehydrogenase
MPEQLTADLAALRDRVDAVARDVLVPLRDDAGIDVPARTAAVRSAAKEVGLYAMTQPVEFGGSGASQLALVVARDTLGSHNVTHLGGLFGPGPGVLAGAGEPIKSRYLAPVLAGEKRGAFGFTEPDDAERATWGRLAGESVIVSGQKSYVTGGADADFINVLVEVEGRGPAMVVIDRDAPGVEVVRTFGSMDGSRHAYMTFSDVEVPAAHIVGAPGEGLPRALRQIGDTRLAFAAESVGLMRWAIDFATQHIAAPHRSGKPLGSREGVRLRYADMRIRAYAARSMVYRTARLADAGENIVNEGIASKVFATEGVGEVVDTAIQLVGGGALRHGHPLEALYRRVRAMRLAEGASDILRLNLARGRLDLGKGRI